MKLRECKVGLPVRVRSVYHSHPLEGFIFRIKELPTSDWDSIDTVVYVMLTNGDYITIQSLSRLNSIQRNSHETE